MSKAIKKTATNDLSKLKAQFAELQLDVPKLSPELTTNPSRHGEKVRMIAAGVRKIPELITTALKLREDQIAFVEAYEDELEREIAEQAVKADILKITEEVGNYLNHKEPFYKAAACRAYLLHGLGLVYYTVEEALKIIKDLEQKELIIRDNISSIKIGYYRYRINEELKLNQKTIDEVVETINNFMLEFEQCERDRRDAKLAEMDGAITISLEEFKIGKVGKCLLEVPAEPILDRNGNTCLDKSGKELWRAGGMILIENKEVGKYRRIHIFPLSASGAIEKDFTSFLKFNLELEHHTLTWETPPGSGKSFDQYQKWAIQHRRLSNEDAETYVRKMQALWFAIQRALNKAEAKE